MEILERVGQTKRGYQPINGHNEPNSDGLQQWSSVLDSNLRSIVWGLLTIVIVLFLLFLLSPSPTSTQDETNGSSNLLRASDPSLEEIIVNITQGSLLGKRLTTRDGMDYLAFLGIPYAKPPVGQLRFKPPKPAEGWTGIRNATQFGSECVQDGRQGGWRGIKGSEDCLNLNVYTPKTLDELLESKGQTNPFPVMVYFHGGALAGNVFYNGGDYLLDEDVLLVTIHYRLGTFGFLNVHTAAASGNQGLKDQVMALKWVQSNIAAFGGDPTRVLLFGESSGSSSITAHLVSPMSKGLFSRTICESGTILDSALFSLDPVGDAFDLGKKLNCAGIEERNVDELMDCLMNMEPEKMVVNTAEAFATRSFLYSVETVVEGEEAFLTDTSLKLFQSGNVSNVVPAMFGVNNQEGISQSIFLLKFPSIMEAYNTNWTQQAINSLHLVPNPNNFTTSPAQIVNAMHDFYFGIGNNLSLAVAQNITDMFSDRDFTHSTYLTAYYIQQAYKKYQEQVGGSKHPGVYLYYLTEQVPQSYWVEVFSKAFHMNVTIEVVKGAGHVDELQFLFRDAGYNYPEIPPGAPQYGFSKMLVHLWTSFAATGIPDTSGYGGQWNPISGTRPFAWYEIHGNNSRMTDALNDRMNFWDSFAITDLYF